MREIGGSEEFKDNFELYFTIAKFDGDFGFSLIHQDSHAKFESMAKKTEPMIGNNQLENESFALATNDYTEMNNDFNDMYLAQNVIEEENTINTDNYSGGKVTGSQGKSHPHASIDREEFLIQQRKANL